MTDKAKKLLFPFLAVTLLYSVPLKYVSGYYRESEHILYDIFVGQILIQGNTHLWFLPTLYIIFIIVFSMEKYSRLNSGGNLIILIAASMASVLAHIELIKDVLYYAVWFYVGYIFETKRNHFNKIAYARKCLLPISAIFFLTLMFLQRVISKSYSTEFFNIAGSSLKVGDRHRENHVKSLI